ncbi:MAG: type II toxin-antitoxin system RatA family toxin, partial [Gammaproteobacteria bacterium]
ADMYALVNDVAAYPDFIHWCRAATVHKETDCLMEASLELSSGGLSKTFTTRNDLVPNRSIDIGLLDGPFRHLEGRWSFGEIDSSASHVELEMRFEFSNPVKSLLFSRMFEDMANSLVDSFARRAHQIYER